MWNDGRPGAARKREIENNYDVIQYFAVLDRCGDTLAGPECESREWRRLLKWF